MEKQMSWGRIITLCVLMLIAFFILNSMISNRSSALESQETQLQVELSNIQDQTAELQTEIKQVGTDSYIENKARSEYNFMKEGELRFSFTNPDALYKMTESEEDTYKDEMGITEDP